MNHVQWNTPSTEAHAAANNTSQDLKVLPAPFPDLLPSNLRSYQLEHLLGVRTSIPATVEVCYRYVASSQYTTVRQTHES